MSRRRVITLDVDPGLLQRVATRTYHMMARTLGEVMDHATRFSRMIRTLTLKRLQDIVESSTGIRPDSFPQVLFKCVYGLNVTVKFAIRSP